MTNWVISAVISGELYSPKLTFKKHTLQNKSTIYERFSQEFCLSKKLMELKSNDVKYYFEKNIPWKQKSQRILSIIS